MTNLPSDEVARLFYNSSSDGVEVEEVPLSILHGLYPEVRLFGPNAVSFLKSTQTFAEVVRYLKSGCENGTLTHDNPVVLKVTQLTAKKIALPPTVYQSFLFDAATEEAGNFLQALSLSTLKANYFDFKNDGVDNVNAASALVRLSFLASNLNLGLNAMMLAKEHISEEDKEELMSMVRAWDDFSSWFSSYTNKGPCELF